LANLKDLRDETCSERDHLVADLKADVIDGPPRRNGSVSPCPLWLPLAGDRGGGGGAR
jgi:hypothetical protein